MILTKDKGLRMWGGGGSTSVGGGGGSQSLSGYATQDWVAENYLSIEFFSKLFKAYGPAETSGDPDVEVVPNDVESTISNIKAMFGLWTDEYLSALGLGPSGGGGLSLNEPLASINTAGLANHPSSAGQTIVWNGSAWAYGTAGAGSVTSVGMTVPTGFVINGSPITSYGTLALSFATGYGLPLTEDVDKGVTAYGWGNHANAGYALASNVYSKADADGRFLTISFFRSLFKAYQSNDTTEVVPNNGDTSLISSIKAMFGFWTEQYISALGLGPSGGGGVTLNEPLASINSAGLSAPTVTGSVLMWNGSSWTYNTQSGTDTKNTAGATNNTAISLYLVGAPSQTANPETYTRTGCYIDANGYLFSGGVKVLTDAVQSIVIGASGTPISPVNGVVTLPEYPTVTDTKNTAGATDLPNVKLYLIGANGQTANPQTYTNSGCYIDANGYLFSGGVKVLTSAVTSVVIGASGTPISPVNGVVTLPAYPSKTSDLTNDSGFITGYTDTKNTAGATDNVNTKLFLIGSTAQGANPQTYTNQSCYIGSDNCLYSGGSKVMTAASGYLPLTGGTLTGLLKVDYTPATGKPIIELKSNISKQAYFSLKTTGTDTGADFGWFSGSDWGVSNTGGCYMFSPYTATGIFVGSNGLYYTDDSQDFDKYVIFGSHNANKSTVDWTCKSLYGNGNLHINFGTNINYFRIGTPSFGWNGGLFPTLYSQPNDGRDAYTMILTPHVPFLKNGSRGYSGTTYGAIIRMEADASSTTPYWDVGIASADVFMIKRNGTELFRLSTSGKITAESVSVNGGTSSGFLKADGSVDNNSYASSAANKTTGATNNTAVALYLVGAYSQLEYTETYTRTGCYISSDGYLYSGGSKVLTSSSGLVTGISVNNSTPYEPINGIVGLPVLPLSGGTLTGSLKIEGTYDLGSAWTRGIIVGSNSYNKVVLGYLGSQTNGAVIGGHNSTLTAWAVLNVCGAGINFRYNETTIASVTNTGFYVGGTLHATGDVNLDGKTFIGSGMSGNYKLLVNGSIICTSVTQTSDVRNKDIIADKTLELWQVAQAPIFTFTWRDKELGFDTHVGTSAQYWKSIVPEAVQQSGNGYLGMQYDVVALLAAVTTAKKVQDHEQRIQALERENETLKNELNRLKAA